VMYDVLTGLTERVGEEQTEAVREESEVLVPPGSEPAPAG
jgi:hypothetical protein